MSRLLAIPFAISAVPALAHPGHLAEQAGHNHYVALAATILAVLIAGFRVTVAIVRWRRRRIAHG